MGAQPVLELVAERAETRTDLERDRARADICRLDDAMRHARVAEEVLPPALPGRDHRIPGSGGSPAGLNRWARQTSSGSTKKRLSDGKLLSLQGNRLLPVHTLDNRRLENFLERHKAYYAYSGEIDIDGSDLAAYDQTDAVFLEEIAALLAPLRPRES